MQNYFRHPNETRSTSTFILSFVSKLKIHYLTLLITSYDASTLLNSAVRGRLLTFAVFFSLPVGGYSSPYCGWRDSPGYVHWCGI